MVRFGSGESRIFTPQLQAAWLIAEQTEERRAQSRPQLRRSIP